MKMEREYLVKSLIEEVPELTVDEANIIVDSLAELLNRSISIGHNVKLIGFGEKPLLFNAKDTDLSPLLAH
ncbi:hypothetical protein ES703_03462 [subsurface metagenome]